MACVCYVLKSVVSCDSGKGVKSISPDMFQPEGTVITPLQQLY